MVDCNINSQNILFSYIPKWIYSTNNILVKKKSFSRGQKIIANLQKSNTTKAIIVDQKTKSITLKTDKSTCYGNLTDEALSKIVDSFLRRILASAGQQVDVNNIDGNFGYYYSNNKKRYIYFVRNCNEESTFIYRIQVKKEVRLFELYAPRNSIGYEMGDEEVRKNKALLAATI